MNSDQIRRLEASWQHMEQQRVALASAFYDRLFELDPSVRDLFLLVDMDSQSSKFLAMLNELLSAIRDPEAFRTVLERSGARHRGYGVLARHYRTVGEALIWSMEKVAPDNLTEEVRSDWIEAYTIMSRIMQQGAERSIS